MPIMPSTVDVSHLIKETVWLERQKYEDAETTYYEGLVASKKKKGQQQQHQVSKGGSSSAAASSILKHPNRESESKQKKMEEIVTPKQEPVKGSGGSAKKSRHSKNKEKKGQVGGTNQTSGSGKGSKAQQVASNKQDVEKEPEKAENAQSAQSRVSLADEISRARQHIKNSLKSDTTLISSKVGGRAEMPELTCRIGQLEDENKRLTKVTDELKSLISKLELRVVQLEGGNKKGSKQSTPAAPAAKQAVASAADDDVDLFASDEENDEEKEKLHQERLKAYESKKSKKPALVAKSNVILDVKPWDDETDMKAMETQVRTVVMDGLVWGASKLVPLAYGIHKLQISCVVEDDKVSIDLLQEQIEAFDELVQSVDIAAFNKV